MCQHARFPVSGIFFRVVRWCWLHARRPGSTGSFCAYVPCCLVYVLALDWLGVCSTGELDLWAGMDGPAGWRSAYL